MQKPPCNTYEVTTPLSCIDLAIAKLIAENKKTNLLRGWGVKLRFFINGNTL